MQGLRKVRGMEQAGDLEVGRDSESEGDSQMDLLKGLLVPHADESEPDHSFYNETHQQQRV